MTENETSHPSALADAKKIWATPEVQDQSIKSATAQGKTKTPTEAITSGKLS